MQSIYPKKNAIRQKCSILILTPNLLVFYLLYFKFASILKQKMHLLCLLLLEKCLIKITIKKNSDKNVVSYYIFIDGNKGKEYKSRIN